MASKQVEDEVHRARDIAQAGRTNADEVARRTLTVFKAAKVRDTADEATIRASIVAPCALLEFHCDALLKADDALTKELGDDAPFLEKRDRLWDEIRRE